MNEINESQLLDLVHHFHYLLRGLIPDVEGFQNWYRLWKHIKKQDPAEVGPIYEFFQSMWKDLSMVVKLYFTYVRTKINIGYKKGLLTHPDQYFQEHLRLLELNRKGHEGRATEEELEERKTLESKHMDRRPRTSTPVELPPIDLATDFADLFNVVGETSPKTPDQDQEEEDLVQNALKLSHLLDDLGIQEAISPLPPSPKPRSPVVIIQPSTPPVQTPPTPAIEEFPSHQDSSKSLDSLSSNPSGSPTPPPTPTGRLRDDYRRQLEKDVEALEHALYSPDQSDSFSRVRDLQEQLTQKEDELEAITNASSAPSNRSRQSVRRRGSQQEVVSATMREPLGKGNHRTTTTTRTTTTVRKGRKAIVKRTSHSVSAPLGSKENDTSDLQGSGRVNDVVEHLRKLYKRRQARKL